MHQALTSDDVITCTSQGQPGASFLKAAVRGISRPMMAFTRCTCAGSRSSASFARACASTCWYAFSALWFTSSDGTSRSCGRLTPTAPGSVAVPQPASSMASAAPKATKRFLIPGRFPSKGAFQARPQESATVPQEWLMTGSS